MIAIGVAGENIRKVLLCSSRLVAARWVVVTFDLFLYILYCTTANAGGNLDLACLTLFRTVFQGFKKVVPHASP